MDKDKVLIIQANIIMKPEELENWRYTFMKQKEEGVVLLPYNFSVVWADKDQIEAGKNLCSTK